MLSSAVLWGQEDAAIGALDQIVLQSVVLFLCCTSPRVEQQS